ncbi:MAG: sigma-70 family RNA polymerase sigma factor [Thermoleophilaceae bacterium]|nr:sigma-70 family RNA polymerase sigma factor [Thermoleophilaceae bacterium]
MAVSAGATAPVATDEAALARLAADGDGAAFATLYDRYENKIFNFCARLTASQEDAADATQDTFVKMLERLPEMKERDLNFGAYLFTVARHSCYRLIERRKKAEPTEEISDLAAMGGGFGGGSAPDPGDPDEDPERRLLLKDQQDEIREANARLPARQREVLVMRELEEMSYEDIAAVMDMNANSVAQLISRARIRLRDELEGTALASIAVTSPECERALPLIAMRHDGQLKNDSDAAWLDEHITSCDTCRASREAMEEAGASYRLWAPVAAFVWLRGEAFAHAAENTGHPWSEETLPPPGEGGTTPGGGGGSGGGGFGGGGFGGLSQGAGKALAAGKRGLSGKRGAARIAATLGVAALFSLAVAGTISEEVLPEQLDNSGAAVEQPDQARASEEPTTTTTEKGKKSTKKQGGAGAAAPAGDADDTGTTAADGAPRSSA